MKKVESITIITLLIIALCFCCGAAVTSFADEARDSASGYYIAVETSSDSMQLLYKKPYDKPDASFTEIAGLSYDEATNVLSMNAYNGGSIETNIPNIKIAVKGASTITSKKNPNFPGCLYFIDKVGDSVARIEGNAKLTIQGGKYYDSETDENYYNDCIIADSNLYLKNTNLNLKGGYSGINAACLEMMEGKINISSVWSAIFCEEVVDHNSSYGKNLALRTVYDDSDSGNEKRVVIGKSGVSYDGYTMKFKGTITKSLTITVGTDVGGKFGDQVWSLNTKSGKFKLSGSGSLEYEKDYPWSEYSGSIKSVEVASGITGFDMRAFAFTPVTSISLPDTVSEITTCNRYDLDAVNGSEFPKLSSISVSSSNKNYCTQSGVLFDKSKATLIYYPAAKSTKTYSIPKGTKYIEEHALSSAAINKLSIPSTLVDLGDEFGYLARFTEITVDKKNSVFKMKSGVLTKNGVELCWYSPKNTSLSYSVASGIQEIAAYAFSSNTGLRAIYLPATVNAVGKKAFDSKLNSRRDIFFNGDAPSLKGTGVVAGEKCCFVYKPANSGWDEPALAERVARLKACDDFNQYYCYEPALVSEDGYVIDAGSGENSLVLELRSSNESAVTDNYVLSSSSTNLGVEASADGRTISCEGKALGSYTVSVTMPNGVKAQAKIQVVPSFRDKSVVNLTVGQKYTNELLGVGKNSVSWSSSNSRVASVSKGKVTAKKAGDCTIKAKVKGVYYSYSVHVDSK